MRNRDLQVCVLTGRQTAAIGSIAIAGDGARNILGRIFQKKGNSPSSLSRHYSLTERELTYGVIIDRESAVDEVVVGCEGTEEFVVHCHGNPLLVERIVKLAQLYGAQLVEYEQFVFSTYQSTSKNLIEAEAQLAIQQCATLKGIKILQSQIEGGLTQWAQDTLNNIDVLKKEEIQCDNKSML